MLFLDRSVNDVRARRTAFIGALVLSCTLMFASALKVNHTFAAPADDSTAVPTSLSTISSVPVAGMLSDTLQTAWASAFVQQTLDSLLAESPVPGLVVAVTTSDTTLVLHGAGMASMEEGKPMNPDSTVVRVASVSKPVTATLLKTLAARGIIDLDGRVPAPTKTSETPTSITYAHLLAHTSGLDGRLLGGGDPIRQPLLGPLLQRRLPPQIDSVGVLSRYSNEGYAWAGTGAARETDSSFPELATSALFEPLRMNRTTFDGESPLLDTAAATGYQLAEEGPRALRRDYITLYPAGGLWTTARDMAAFLQVFLKHDEADANAALSASATRLDVGDPRDDFAGRRGHLGWFHQVLRGYDLFVHGGSYPGWGSYVVVSPDLNLGVFVAGNAVAANSLGEALALDLAARWATLRSDSGRDTEAQTVRTNLSVYNGTYRIARRPHTSFESFFTLFGAPYPDVTVRAVADTALTVNLADGPTSFRLVQHDSTEGTDVFVRTDEWGMTVTGIGTPAGQGPAPRLRIGTATFEKISAFQSRSVQFGYMILCLIMITSIFYWPIREFFRPGDSEDKDAPEGMQYARPLAIFAAALHVGFLFAIAFRFFTGGPLGPIHTDPGVIRPLLAFPIVASTLSLGLVVFGIRAWLTDAWSMGVRVHFSAVTLGMIIYIPFLLYWGLIGVPVA